MLAVVGTAKCPLLASAREHSVGRRAAGVSCELERATIHALLVRAKANAGDKEHGGRRRLSAEALLTQRGVKANCYFSLVMSCLARASMWTANALHLPIVTFLA